MPFYYKSFLKHALKFLPSVSFSKGMSTVKQTIFQHLKTKIQATGPITVADYMKEILVSPFGYYMKKDVFGSSGDFITSPEISQIFGELIGIWFCNEWQKAGSPLPLQLVEFGPGRGTLADDILRVFSKVLSLKNNISVHLVEVSQHMRKLQRNNLSSRCSDSSLDVGSKYISKYGYPFTFHECIESVPDCFSFFLAHEFFDVLPIHKFQKMEDGWREVLIDCRNEELQFVLSRNATPAAKYLIDSYENRDHLEVCPEAGILMQNLCKRMEEDGGITLIIDYGHNGDKTDTFRSFKEHKLHDPLKDPGEADLTADVDFSYLRKCIKGKGYTAGPVSQAQFLKNMGINFRLATLMQNASPEVQESLKSGYDMLTKTDQMGERFKFFAIYPKVLDVILEKCPPAGF